MNNKQILGKRFGRLTPVVYLSGSRQKRSKWLCSCDCGNTAEVVTNNLTSGKTKSCGCLSSELLSERNRTHGLRFTHEYSVWQGMINRCTNPNSTSYERYGGRGISVCERWRNNFESFLSDMGNRPSELHSIERINNNGNYEPSNCKWATSSEQNRNKRKHRNNKSGVKGVAYCKTQNHWVAYWNTKGKQKRRSFSVNKYGYGEAFNLACKVRGENNE